MRSALLVAFLVLCAAAPGKIARAQTTPWSGTVHSTHFNGGITETISGTLRFDYVETSPGGDASYAVAAGEIIWSISGTYVETECSYNGSETFQIDTAVDNGGIGIRSDGLYRGSFFLDVSRLENKVTVSCPDQDPYVRSGFHLAPFLTLQDFYVREDGTLLKEAYTAEYEPDYWTSYEWEFRNRPSPVELVVRLDDYDTWIPQAGVDEDSPGNSIFAVAESRSKDGVPLTTAAENFAFRLIDTSQEPGICMNFPAADKAKLTYDLKITETTDVPIIEDPDGQWMFVFGWVEDGVQQAQVAISAYDFGAYGRLQVTAYMADGDSLVGYLEDEPEVTLIRLPKSAEGSRIAEQWLREMGSMGSPDMLDEDDQPAGDDHSGDGLTIYEEYRGFREFFRHIRTDPREKDLFIYDGVGGDTKLGIAHFEAISELTVHDDLMDDEIDTTARVINFNYTGLSPHYVDQHALWIKSRGGIVGESVPVQEGAPPGPPKTTAYINLYEPDSDEDLKRHIAHELLHGVSVYHHGDHDRFVEWSFQRDSTGAFFLDGGYFATEEQVHDEGSLYNGIRIRKDNEAGERYIPTILQAAMDAGIAGIMVYVGEQWGEHSGNELCVMRYNAAQYYTAGSTIDRFEAAGGERAGLGLCTSAVGTGVNDVNHDPRWRYGDADSNGDGRRQRGNCKGQICVNDFYDHPAE